MTTILLLLISLSFITREQNNPELLHQAAQLEALPESWRDYFQEQSRRQDMK
ncbi:MAG: 3-alpha domain-containing protein [Nostoc sp.]|uniref:3-alpha domain-containing protein n=1 Tax=Nostoc sp. TaxID=1180 RepID=UPI002FF629BD